MLTYVITHPVETGRPRVTYYYIITLRNYEDLMNKVPGHRFTYPPGMGKMKHRKNRHSYLPPVVFLQKTLA